MPLPRQLRKPRRLVALLTLLLHSSDGGYVCSKLVTAAVVQTQGGATAG